LSSSNSPPDRRPIAVIFVEDRSPRWVSWGFRFRTPGGALVVRAGLADYDAAAKAAEDAGARVERGRFDP
jgi:hypothetical protein